MQTMLRRLTSEFRRRQPNVDLSIAGGGSAKGVSDFLGRNGDKPKGSRFVPQPGAGKPVILASSRTMATSEIQEFAAAHGYEPTVIPIAMDAVAFYVYKDNPIVSLTLDQVDGIFSSTRRRGQPKPLDTWGQLGLTGAWEGAQIRLYGRDKKSGTREFVRETVLMGGEFDEAIHEEPGAASVILALSRDEFGIGYSGLGLMASSVRIVPLAEKAGDPTVAPTVTTVMDGSYPLRRYLYLYVDNSPKAGLPPAIREFLAFLNSREGRDAVVATGFYPVPIRAVDRPQAAMAAPAQKPMP